MNRSDSQWSYRFDPKAGIFYRIETFAGTFLADAYSPKVGNRSWYHVDRIKVRDLIDANLLPEYSPNPCNSGHFKTPENVFITKSGSIRCRECKRKHDKDSKARIKSKLQPPSLEIEKSQVVESDNESEKLSVFVPLMQADNLEFNCNAQVRRNRSKNGWGDVQMTFKISRKEAKLLGQKLIQLADAD